MESQILKTKNIILDNRLTHQRLVVLDYLRNGKEKHPTAEEVYLDVKKSLPQISLSTVYRILNFLKDKGYILEIQSTDRKVRYDSHHNDHCHFICERCTKISNIKINHKSNSLPKVKIGEITVCLYNYYGVCKECKK